jgi:hypothetical protein
MSSKKLSVVKAQVQAERWAVPRALVTIVPETPTRYVALPRPYRLQLLENV